MADSGVPPELLDLSRLMPIVVLVPRSIMDEREISQEPSRNAHVVQIDHLNDRSSLVRAAMTHFQCDNVEDVAAFGVVDVRFYTMEAYYMGQPVVMTLKEFKMLEYMVKNPRKVLSRDELLKQVWGYKCYPTTRTVDTHILKLRSKLEQDPSEPRHFLKVHGIGYRFVP
jgi:DNA-binding response OmpR family regulator